MKKYPLACETAASLLELILTLGLHSVLFLGISMSLAEFLGTRQVRHLGDRILHCIRQTHLTALIEGQAQHVHLSRTSLSCPTNRMPHKVTFPSSLSVRLFSLSPTKIFISKEGAVSPTRLEVSNRFAQCTLRFSLRGRGALECHQAKRDA